MRYKITIEYDGTNYCGLQKQIKRPQESIEEALENAVFSFSNKTVKIFASGRTDAGVHALGQVVHFDLDKQYDAFTIKSGLNHFLIESGIAIVDCEIVDEAFHARYNGKARTYCYKIINRRAPAALMKDRAWHYPNILDVEEMNKAAQFLVGNHDFSSFRGADCSAKTAIKNINQITITKDGDEINIEITANSFLRHMIRNIVGTLSWVGVGKIKAQEMPIILEAKDRTKSGPKAPAHGLYFLKVDY